MTDTSGGSGADPGATVQTKDLPTGGDVGTRGGARGGALNGRRRYGGRRGGRGRGRGRAREKAEGRAKTAGESSASPPKAGRGGRRSDRVRSAESERGTSTIGGRGNKGRGRGKGRAAGRGHCPRRGRGGDRAAARSLAAAEGTAEAEDPVGSDGDEESKVAGAGARDDDYDTVPIGDGSRQSPGNLNGFHRDGSERGGKSNVGDATLFESGSEDGVRIDDEEPAVPVASGVVSSDGDSLTEPSAEDADAEDESLLRARSDLELLLAAYPDEIDASPSSSSAVSFILCLPPAESGAFIEMELPRGYPVGFGVRVKSYRGGGYGKSRVEAAVAAVRDSAAECVEYGEEGGLACCAAALESWEEHGNSSDNASAAAAAKEEEELAALARRRMAEEAERWRSQWITGETLVDRKSVFQAHVCPVCSERDVAMSLQALISGSTKIQRASHNMFAYRFTESLSNGRTLLKHDNDDDGEDGAGSRIAHLLQMRDEDGVLVVVSRWYGGVHLGPARFTVPRGWKPR